jgi:tripartite-type tricarboxylate transporter receptor subunit TctC
MKKFTKVMAFVLVLTLSLTLALAGCAGKSAEEPKKDEPAKTEEPKKDEAKKEIDWPKKTIQVVVPFKAGGDTDFNARTYAKYLEKELGQPLVVVNTEGAGGTVGSKKVKDSKPDGYTVLFYHPSMLINQVTGMVDYGFEDFEMAGIAAMDEGNLFLVNKDSKYKTLKDLVEDAKANPGIIKYGTEMGGFTFFQGLTLQDAAGVEFNLVDVGGGTAKTAALKGGHVDFIPNPYGLVKSLIESGDFRPLAVTSENRNPKFTDIPTAKEQGYDVVLTKPYFFAFPKGTPKEIVDKFSKAVENVAKNNAEYAKDIEKAYSLTPTYMNPEDSVAYLSKMKAQFMKFKDKVMKK